MAATTTTSKPTDGQSKRKAKLAQASVRSNEPIDEQATISAAEIGADGAQESNYIKELQRNIRNVNKKLAAMQKVDSVVAENPNVSLDDLVAQRKINNDQKAQALKKPSLQAQLVQLEEQIVQFKKFEDETQRRFAAEKEETRVAHEQELQAARESTSATGGKDIRSKYLVLSRFLRAAAARRQSGEDETTEESQAFEGVLLMLYSGDTTAVDAMEKLVNGVEDKVLSTAGEAVNVSYGRVKEISFTLGGDDEDEDAAVQPHLTNGNNGEDSIETDPTLANASLTELQQQRDGDGAATGATPAIDQLAINDGAEQTTVDNGASNAAGAEHYTAGASADASGTEMGDSWVSVPRDPAEVENSWGGAEKNATTNWADEVPPAEAPSASATPSNDGFNEVVRSRGGRGGARGGNRGRGGPREGGERRGGRGGFRGEGRGRGGEGGERGRGRGGRGGRGRGE